MGTVIKATATHPSPPLLNKDAIKDIYETRLLRLVKASSGNTLPALV